MLRRLAPRSVWDGLLLFLAGIGQARKRQGTEPREERLLSSGCRAIVLAGVLAITASSGGHADCQGQDLFPKLEEVAPSAYNAIEQDARAMPFGRGKLFLSREGTEHRTPNLLEKQQWHSVQH